MAASKIGGCRLGFVNKTVKFQCRGVYHEWFPSAPFHKTAYYTIRRKLRKIQPMAIIT